VETDAAIEESEGNPAGAKARTCYIGRSLMTQADLDALRLGVLRARGVSIAWKRDHAETPEE
jgi:hypothetical protein